MNKQIKIIYTGNMNLELDTVIKNEMKRQGYDWYAQGYDFISKTRDLAFDDKFDEKAKERTK